MSGSWQDEERSWEREAGLRPPGTGGDVTPEEANWAVAAALLAFAGYVMPLLNIAGPAAVWLAKRDESAFVEYHAREALNFQISITLYMAAASLLMFVVIGFVLVPLLVVFDVVVIIVAALRASRGELYEYPLSLRLISGPAGGLS
ncbi:MAG: DUF4870 domain-containing protein [Actinomycetota bacterium]|nr:DUF4870 domain-containing protein [Actinomycetota bacterium]